MNYSFDDYIERRGTESQKWDGYHKDARFPEMVHNRELLPLWVADMDFKCAPAIIDVVRDKIQNGASFGYAEPRSKSFVDTACSWVERRYHHYVEKDWIVFTPGVIAGLMVAIQTHTHPGDGILIQRPVYGPFSDCINQNGRMIVDSPLKPVNGKFHIDFDDLEKKASLSSTKLMILCNPHNPIGRVWTREELEKVAEICIRNHVVIFSDEVHCDLIFKGYQHTSIATLSDKAEDITITAHSASKAFNVAGLQTSFVIISDPVMRADYIRQHTRNKTCNVNCFGSAVMQAAYTKCDDWLREVVTYIEANVDFMEEYIKQHLPKVKMYRPEGTYLVWLDFSEGKMTDEEFVSKMLLVAGIAVDFGSWFGPGNDCCARFNVACPRMLLEDAMHRLERAFK